MAEITKEKIENRKSTLQADLERLVSHIKILDGAIQDCDWFLEELNREEPKEPEVVDSGN